MAFGITRRRVIMAVVALVVVGVAATVGMRVTKKPGDGGALAKDAPVALAFAPGDVTYVEAQPFARVRR